MYIMKGNTTQIVSYQFHIFSMNNPIGNNSQRAKFKLRQIKNIRCRCRDKFFDEMTLTLERKQNPVSKGDLRLINIVSMFAMLCYVV